MSYLKRVHLFARLSPLGIVFKIAFAFAVVIWLSSFGGGNKAKGADFTIPTCAAQ